MSDGGSCIAATLGGATATLGSVATTLGAVGWWVTLTLGSVAGRAIWVVGGRACVVCGVGCWRVVIVEDCSEAFNSKELCVAVVRCSICSDSDGERPKAVDDSIGG